jgi:regulator of nucleoside diphosphate kinase
LRFLDCENFKDVEMNNERPAITISSLDADRLYNLIESVPATVSGVKELEAELDRANIVEPHEVPSTIYHELNC